MRNILAITKALADLNRVRILCALSERGELCVCQVQELLALAPSSTSKHLSILSGAGLLSVRKKGRWAYYSVTEAEELPEEGAQVVGWITGQAAKEKVIREDRQLLNEILAYSPEELCQRQANGQRCCFSGAKTSASARSQKVSSVL